MKRKLRFLSALLLGVVLSQAVRAAELWVGESCTLDAASDVIGLTSDIQWTTSNSAISLSGSDFACTAAVKAYFSGEATVTCSWKFRLYSTDEWQTTKKTWTLTCKDNPLSLSPATMLLGYDGDSDQLTYSFAYGNEFVSAATVTFSSSNTVVAVVDEKGKVTGKSTGTATITCRSNISANAATCEVTVNDIAPTGIQLPETLSLKYGATYTLTPTLLPIHASSDVSWSSSNPAIAYVNSQGMVYAVGAGEAVVTATTDRGGYTASCNVTVQPKPTHFIVCLKDAKRIAYSLVDRPCVVASADKVTLTDKDITVEYPLSDIEKYVLGVADGSSSGIAQAQTASDGGSISQSAGQLTLSGFAAGTSVAVYDAGGRLVKSLAVKAGGVLTISLAEYPAGAYIVKAASKTIKFVKR